MLIIKKYKHVYPELGYTLPHDCRFIRRVLSEALQNMAWLVENGNILRKPISVMSA
jgi:hypothetical protein